MHFIPFGPKPGDSLSQNVKHLSYKDLAYTFDRKHRFYERKKQIFLLSICLWYVSIVATCIAVHFAVCHDLYSNKKQENR